MEELGLSVGFILTLMVFSYLIRDNLLYRIAVYSFVGLTAGFVTIITTESVLLPWFDVTFGAGDVGGVGLGLMPVVILLLLVFKASPRLGCLGNLGMAFMVGVGAAVAIAGALSGTLVPLSVATINVLPFGRRAAMLEVSERNSLSGSSGSPWDLQTSSLLGTSYSRTCDTFPFGPSRMPNP